MNKKLLLPECQFCINNSGWCDNCDWMQATPNENEIDTAFDPVEAANALFEQAKEKENSNGTF